MKYLPLLLLAGCGGGTEALQPIASPPAQPTTAAVEPAAPVLAGLWTDAAGDTLLIAPNGDFTLTSALPNGQSVEVGTLTQNGSEVSGNYSQGAETPTGCAGVGICYASTGAITGALSQGSLTLGDNSFVPATEPQIPIAGNWSLPAGAISDTSAAVLTISGSGQLYEQDPNGCIINGQVNANGEAYTVSWTFGPQCQPDWAGATATGLAYFNGSQLQIAVSISGGFIALYDESAA